MTYDNYETLQVSVEAGIASVTFEHGEINLLDAAMFAEIDRVGRELAADDAVRVVILQSANPDFFIAHADVNLIAVQPPAPAPREEALSAIHAAFDRFRSMPKVTIAKIAGRCRGGGSELALACDMRFGAIGKAFLGQPEAGVGIIPGAGGSTRLPRLVGRGRALEIMLGAGDYSAELAERYGYINRALPAGELDFFVGSLARRIAGFPAATLAQIKGFVDGLDPAIENDLCVEERRFLESVHFPQTIPRLHAALAAGLQTRDVELCHFDHIWAPLAGI